MTDHVRTAMRRLARQPLMTLLILLTLAIGIGANTAMFSTLDAVLLRALPWQGAERIVVGRKSFDEGLTNSGPVSAYDFYDYQEQMSAFEEMAALTMFTNRMTLTGTGEPDRVDVGYVTWNLFPMLGVAPAEGRSFSQEEATVGAGNVVILSNGYWRRRFDSDPSLIGRTLNISGRSATVIGVMPPGFRFLFDTDVWTLTYRDGPYGNARRWHNLLLVGRLDQGVSVGQAQEEADVVSTRLAEEYPDTNKGKTLVLMELHDYMVEGVRTSLLLLMGTVVLVLLIACGNVAGLLLARGQSRASEVAVRSAIGASRRQLVTELMTENLLIALLAGGLGIVLAGVFQRLVLRLLPVGAVGSVAFSLDTGVLAFTLVVSVITALLFGVLPALKSTAVDPSSGLRSGSRTSDDRQGTRLRSGMVVLQVALSLFLLVGAGLLIRSLARQTGVDLGFDPKGVLAADIQLPTDRYPDRAARVRFFDAFVERVAAIPGVQSASAINQLPIRNPYNDIYAWPAGSPPTDQEDTRSAFDRIVLPGYFDTIGIPLLAGRDIGPQDTDQNQRVVVLSETMARDYFPDVDPIGQHLVIDMGETVDHVVVGIVGDARLTAIRSDPYATMYTAQAQRGNSVMRLALRTDGSPESMVPAVRSILRDMDADIPLAEPASMTSVVDENLADYRVITFSLGLFSFIALLLTAIGLYGVLAFYVGERMNELGIRVAIGATGGDILGLVIRRGVRLALLGVLLGGGAAAVGTRLVRQLLYETPALDPAAFGGAVLFVLLVAGIASLLPALRAVRVDPLEALRAE